MSMFGGYGGYWWLDSYIMAEIVLLATRRFCRRFLNRTNDPCGRQFDQMTQAARSGCANTVEGSARNATSRETEMRLTDVGRASLAELQNDYVNWLLESGTVPWPKDSAESQAVYAVWLDKPNYDQDVVHDGCVHILAQQKKFAQWLNADDANVIANTLLILIARTINMLNHQLESQGEQFKDTGGFREKLSGIRHEVMAGRENAPTCPECGAPMRKRIAKSGKNLGQPFWGCSKYPACSGLLPFEETPSNNRSPE